MCSPKKTLRVKVPGCWKSYLAENDKHTGWSKHARYTCFSGHICTCIYIYIYISMYGMDVYILCSIYVGEQSTVHCRQAPRILSSGSLWWSGSRQGHLREAWPNSREICEVPALTSSNGGPWLIPLVFYVFFRSSQTSIDYRTHFHLNYLSDLASSGTLRLLGLSCTIAELAQKLHQDHVQVNMKLMKKSSQVLRSAGKSASKGLWRLHVWMLGGTWQKPGQKYGGFLHPRLVVSNIYRFMMIYDDSWLFNHTCNGRLRLGLGWKYQPRSWVCHGARGIRGRLALLETRFGVLWFCPGWHHGGRIHQISICCAVSIFVAVYHHYNM